MTASAPKSFSIAWSLADPELRRAMDEKFNKALRIMMDVAEDKVGWARVGTDGVSRVKCPLLFVCCPHSTSRAEDQQRHEHLLLLNITKHEDGHTTAIDPTFVGPWKMALGAVFRAALAQGMLELGYTLRERKIGSSIGWELACIPQSYIDLTSKRRAEIEEKLALRKGCT